MNTTTLIVGAGAVGLAYGWMLKQAGAQVRFLVKPKHLEALSGGVQVWPQNKRAETWELDLVTEPVPADQVWYAVSSTALPHCPLDWPAGTLVVMLQPGLHDREVFRGHVDDADLVRGIIPFLSWPSPLPGEQREGSGTAWWFPPLMRLPFSGPRANEVTRLLPRAHMVADVAPDLHRNSARLLPLIAELEVAGWSLAKLDKERASGAIGEASAILCAHHGLPAAKAPPALLLSLLAFAAPHVVPVDLETFFRVHFTKVGDQTRRSLEAWVQRGGQLGLSTAMLEALRRRLG